MENTNNEELLMQKDIDRMNTIFRVDHVLDMIGIPCFEQIGINRYYSTGRFNGTDLPEIVVNMPRSEWICREKGEHGKLSDILDFLKIKSQDENGSYMPLYYKLVEYYHHQMTADKSVSINAIRIGKNNVTMEDNIGYETAIGLSRLGISLRTLQAAGCETATVYNRQTGRLEQQLSFGCDNGSGYLYNGTVFRPIDDPGITTIGEISRDQNCYVYHNPLDYLAMMELRHRRRVDFLLRKDYHLVINGERNIEQACQFLKDNPDFAEVRTILPAGDDSKPIFGKLCMATSNVIVNYSDIFNGYTSLLDKAGFQVPPFFKEILTRKKNQDKEVKPTTEEAQETDVSQQASHQQGKEKDMPQGLGRSQTITVADERRGGMKM